MECCDTPPLAIQPLGSSPIWKTINVSPMVWPRIGIVMLSFMQTHQCQQPDSQQKSPFNVRCCCYFRSNTLFDGLFYSLDMDHTFSKHLDTMIRQQKVSFCPHFSTTHFFHCVSCCASAFIHSLAANVLWRATVTSHSFWIFIINGLSRENCSIVYHSIDDLLVIIHSI